MRVIAKFGGTSLGNGDRVNRAADSIAAAVEAGHQAAIVASAMGSTTDEPGRRSRGRCRRTSRRRALRAHLGYRRPADVGVSVDHAAG